MPYARFGNLRIYYEIHGPPAAYPVVLIHPIGGNILIWKHEIPLLLNAGFRVVAYELRGHYRTPMVNNNDDNNKDGEYSIQDLAGDLRMLLEHLNMGTRKYILIGHSIGGMIASLYAAQYAEDIDGIIMINSSPKRIPDKDLEKHFKTREIARTKGIEALASHIRNNDESARDLLKEDEDKWHYFREIFTKTSVEGFVAATLSLYTMPKDVVTSLRKTRCSVFAIVGSDDEVFVRLLTETKQEMPEMVLHVIKGGDHWLILENPQELDRILLEFLRKITTTATTSGSLGSAD